MKCPACGYNSFDYLETCKKCGAPLGGDSLFGASASDVSSGDTEQDTQSYGRRDEATPEELFENPITEREDASHLDRLVSTELGYERSDYVRNSEEGESFEDDSISNERHINEYGSPRSGSVSRDAGKHMDLFDEDEGADYSRENAYFLNDDMRAYEEDVPETLSESYENETVIFNLAGFVSRTAAFIIDFFIVSMTAFFSIIAGLYVLNGLSGDTGGLKNIIFPLYLALFLLASTYFMFLHGFGGKTVGKMILGIRLINGEGDYIGLWDAFVRWIGYFVSAGFLFIGFLWALFDSEGQAWHDKIAGTYVVRD